MKQHDHHLWNLAREKQHEENYMARTRGKEELQPEFQTIKMFNNCALNPIDCDFLSLVVKPLLTAAGIRFLAVYPSFALINGDKSRCVVFHHGHYVEPIHSLMTGLKNIFFPREKRPHWIWDLEAENGAWIDFFWSALSDFVLSKTAQKGLASCM